MKLNRLLELHHSNQDSISLVHNLGDGLLCHSNKIFANIRRAALEAGYQFSHKENNFYEALPLSQLENILVSKLIPFTDNVSVLANIEKKYPQITRWEDISLHLKRNFLFHESCHAVARSRKPASLSQDESTRVLQMLFEESFANTCELLAAGDAHETAHKIFYEINSYSSLFEEQVLLNSLRQELGSEFLMKFLILVYLCSNYLFENLTDQQFQRILVIAQDSQQNKLSTKQIKNLKLAASICFTLDEDFKLVTTRFYLRLNGIKAETNRHLEFDFISYIENEISFQKYLNVIVNLAQGQTNQFLSTE